MLIAQLFSFHHYPLMPSLLKKLKNLIPLFSYEENIVHQNVQFINYMKQHFSPLVESFSYIQIKILLTFSPIIVYDSRF
jgi:hypothetical protein